MLADVQHVVQDRDWVDYLTLGAAIFAAVGTVGAVIVALWQTSKQSKNKATVWTVMGDSRDGGQRWHVKVHNSGLRAFTVEYINFYAEKSTDILEGVASYEGYHGRTLPQMIQPGQTIQVTYTIPQVVLSGSSPPYWVIATDSTGQRHSGPFNPFSRWSGGRYSRLARFRSSWRPKVNHPK